MKAKQIAILLALTTMMIAGCGSNTKNADSQTEVSTSTETTDELHLMKQIQKKRIPIPARLQMKQQIRSRKLQIREMEIMKTILR